MSEKLFNNDSLLLVKKSTDVSIYILDTLINNLSEFCNKVQKLHIALEKTYKTLPKVEKKTSKGKNIFSKSKNGIDTSEVEPEFTNIFNYFLKIMVEPPCLMELRDHINNELINGLEKIRAQYMSSIKRIQNSYEFSKNTIKSIKNTYSSIFKEYSSICDQIEEIHTALDIQETQAITSQFEALKTQFFEKEKELSDMLDTLNNGIIDYNVSVNRRLSEWEEEELSKEHSIQQLFNEFAQSILSVSVKIEESRLDLKMLISQYNFDKDHASYKSPIFDIPLEQRYFVKFTQPELSINILDYVDAKEVFADELKETTDTAKENYDEDCHIEADEELTVHSVSDDGSKAIVTKNSTGETMCIPNSILAHMNPKERTLMKLTNCYTSGGITVNSGDVVCAVVTTDEKTMCTTVDGKKLEIPLSILSQL